MSKEQIINAKYLENKIYIIRGQKVMLDSDLAEIYGYTTKAFNQQIQRNIEKFDEDFMFRVDEKDLVNLRSQIATSRLDLDQKEESSIRSQFVTGWYPLKEDDIRCKNSTGSHRNSRFRPYVFTEQGIYMLMTVLKGDLAVKQSKALIRLFKFMKDYINENRDLLPYKCLKIRTTNLEVNYKEVREDLNIVMKNFDDPSIYKHFLITDG